ncbi:Type II secretion system protein F [Lacipirellula limnantheis]|uniref:Type II secretion system protein F n=2 Tax=Lacipirellula limnantheis TaxID=2528024 RepID=A0A517U3M3_9BACT|nr:Type II secretion system protein F [Lacipirellula limnantheis]
MDTASLDDFMALNDQITALIRAQVPTGLELGSCGDQAAGTLEKINAAVARRVSRGESLADAIGDEPTAPAAYRSVMQAGWRSGNVQQALDNSSRLAESAEESRYRTRAAFFYPFLVCALAAVGITGFCLFIAPALAGLYLEFQIPESKTLRLLESLEGAVPYLIIGGVLLLAAIGLASLLRGRHAGSRRASDGHWWSGLTGASQTQFHQRCANFCEQLITLLDAGVSLAEGVPLAADACGDRTLEQGARAYAVAQSQRSSAASEERAARLFPPFLRWALWQTDESLTPSQALRLAASVYRESAQRRAEQSRIAIPIVACVFLGGGATLLYGLALFLPITELLQALAR